MRCEPKLIVAAVAMLTLSGCASVDPGFGNAYRYDMAVQTIDPDPVYDEDGAKPGDSGEKGAKASKRYRDGQTKPVETQRVGGPI